MEAEATAIPTRGTSANPGGPGGATPRFGTPTTPPPPPTNCWPEAPWGGGGHWRGGLGGAMGGGLRQGRGGGGLRECRSGGVEVGRFGSGGGGVKAPLTSPCPPSNHCITINLTLTFAASWFGHARHVDWAEQDPSNFVHGCFCHIIALHFGPQHSL